MQNETLAKAAVKFALQQLGNKEATGHNDGPFVKAIARWYANGAEWMDGQFWCTTFVTWCIYRVAGEMNITPILNKNNSATTLKKEAEEKGLVLEYPVVNCIGLLPTPDGLKFEHAFLVYEVDPANGVVFSIDGNWGNAVAKTMHKIEGCTFVAVA